MGLAIDPSQTADYVLEIDREKPEPRPTFHFRYLNRREFTRLSKALREAEAVDDVDKRLDAYSDALKLALVGWSNMSMPYKADDFDLVTTYPDLVELAHSILDLLTVGEIDLKNSVRQLRSQRANSAATAATESIKPTP